MKCGDSLKPLFPIYLIGSPSRLMYYSTCEKCYPAFERCYPVRQTGYLSHAHHFWVAEFGTADDQTTLCCAVP